MQKQLIKEQHSFFLWGLFLETGSSGLQMEKRAAFGTVATPRVRIVCHSLQYSSLTLWYKSQVHIHEEGHQASHIGVVWKIPTSQLLVGNYPVLEKQV